MQYIKNKINYFKLFKISQNFYINKKLLKKNFYKLQIKYHPDKINKNFFNILDKKINSQNINKGYQILKNDFKRAKYLLLLIAKKKIIKKTVNQKILIKQFELYEKIEHFKNLKNNFQKILIFILNLKKKIKKYFIKVNIEFEKKNILKIQNILHKLFFLKKILKKINFIYNKKKTDLIILKK
ncbi:Fe-S protein assembly co-chaperone HscB [Buchnera aphidicola]|uniref:Fe-S protein assembly co-chaperone HscB n=1 Tax=Buchnera aphidicola TaxID=9 RepID=UPI0031B68502